MQHHHTRLPFLSYKVNTTVFTAEPLQGPEYIVHHSQRHFPFVSIRCASNSRKSQWILTGEERASRFLVEAGKNNYAFIE